MRQTIENSFGESVWKRLQKKDITSREEALQFLVDVKGNVHLEQLDSDLSDRFFSKFRDRSTIPHVIPLLLWKGELDIGSPITLSNKQKEVILHNVGAKTVNIIPITEDSYIRWFRRQRPLDQHHWLFPID